MRKVALRSGLIAAGLILGTAVWLMATPVRLGAG